MSNIFDMISDGLLEPGDVVTEAAFPESISYLKTVSKQVSLPQGNPIGRGNLCFLYSHNLTESLSMMNNNLNFSNRNHYKYYYYNVFYQGKIYNKKYRFRELEERKDYYKIIEERSTIIPRLKLVNTTSDNRNMYYDLFRYLEIFESICKKLQPLRYTKMYWDYLSKILALDIPGYEKRFVLVDLSRYPLSKSVKESLTNPLYLLYYTALRMPDVLTDINIDFYFYSGKKVLKINPSQLTDKSHMMLRIEMNKIMHGITPQEVINTATNDTEIQKDEIESDSVAKITKVFDTSEDDTIITNHNDLVKLNKVSAVEKEIVDKVKEKSTEVKEIVGDNPVNTEQISDTISKNVKKEIDSDKDMVEKIYYQAIRNDRKRSDASTARDKMLREEQKNIQLGNMTIGEIEKINANNIPIPVHDVSKVVNTTNDNMKQLKFMNLDKTYNEKLMKKDIANAILSLNDKSIPMFVRDVKIEDTSDELNYKDTYTILLEDSNRKRHTVKVDIPKFIDDRFLYIGGNKKIIKHQSFFLPVVKISHNMVQIVTNYSKMTIERVENKSMSSIERLKKLVNSNENVRKYFSMGGVFANNAKYITTLEYDDLSKMFSTFRSGSTFLMFDQNVAHDYMQRNHIADIDKKMFIGKNKGKDCFIDINTQEDESGQSIVDIITSNMTEDLSTEFSKTKAPKRLMYTKVRIMSQFVSVAMLLGLWEGLSSILKKLKVDYRLEDKIPQTLKSNEEFLKFSDCVMIYKQDIPTALIMNGFKLFDTTKYRMVDFDDKEPYIDYIKKVYGKSIIENALMNFYEFAIDNITYEILKDQSMPTDIVSLFVYAINLLSDSQYIPDINQNFSRIRCNEIIPAILYERIAKNYVAYRNYNGRKKFSLPQDCVIKEVLALKTVEDYSTLNPTLEMEQIHGLSAKGFRGVNLDKAYTIPKRSYDPSMEGVVAASTSPDGQVGVSKTLTMEPRITNLRGFTEDNHKELEKLKDVNLFSPGELTMPLCPLNDDPNRLG